MGLTNAQFIRSIVSTQTKYDVVEASDFSNFTDEVVLTDSTWSDPSAEWAQQFALFTDGQVGIGR
ncbi:MAG: hypothetical protein AAF546_11515 [Verrucomicrobiota bacterium]